MEENRIIQNFEGKTILITGATGFLAKIFVEKILRLQPNVKKLFLLIRASNIQYAKQRLQQEIIDTELFRVLKNMWGENITSLISSKVIPIPGDVSLENLGIINTELINEMYAEIDFIINSAATTRFDERYDVAMDINACGAMHVLNFAKKCAKLKLLLHISTAYVHGTRSGLLIEEPFQMGATLEGAKVSYLVIDAETKLVEQTKRQVQARNTTTENDLTLTLRNLGNERANLHGWPNTYTFTKAMGEMILGHYKENINVIIIRPTIITSTYREPFPGWMEGLRTLDAVFVAYGKQQLKFFLGDPGTTLDIIPGDMVVNALLVVIAVAIHSQNASGDNQLKIYHVGSSLRNPIKYEQVRWLMYEYLKKNPLYDNRGKPIKVEGEFKTLTSITSYHRYVHIHYLPFLRMLKVWDMIAFNKNQSSYAALRQEMNKFVGMAELYKPYALFQGIFDDANTQNLRTAMKHCNADAEMFDFDPKSIQWEDYFTNIHFPGIVKYVLK